MTSPWLQKQRLWNLQAEMRRTRTGCCGSYDVALLHGLLKGVGKDLHKRRSFLFGLPVSGDVEAHL